MKPKLFHTLLLICMICMGTKAIACSPARIPFDVYVNRFTPDEYYAVEGYYVDATTFMVVRSSDTLMVKEGKALPVFEYGPFGSMCEVYALAVHIDDAIIGKEHPRVLILYKNETSEEKLMIPIFLSSGVSLKDEVAELNGYKYTDGGYQNTKSSTSKSALYERLFNGSKVALVWDEQIFKPTDN